MKIVFVIFSRLEFDNKWEIWHPARKLGDTVNPELFIRDMTARKDHAKLILTPSNTTSEEYEFKKGTTVRLEGSRITFNKDDMMSLGSK